MPPRKVLMPGKKEATKEDPVYKEKRNKNNDAVKKSRQKTKVKSEETMRKVAILKQVNENLILLNIDKIKNYFKYIFFYFFKSLPLAVAGRGVVVFQFYNRIYFL